MRIVTVPVCLAFVALAAAGCAPAKPRKADVAPTVTVAHPLLYWTVVDWDDYLGRIRGRQNSVDVRPRVSGYLQSVGFKDGDVVRKGQVL